MYSQIFKPNYLLNNTDKTNETNFTSLNMGLSS